jgi:hypothetical protein
MVMLKLCTGLYVTSKVFYSSPKQVKTTHGLLEGKAHLPGDELLIVAEYHWIADLFPLTVTFYLAIQSG